MISKNTAPVQELLMEGEFTDRVEILLELEDWYKNIADGISSSLAFLAPRRMGKTAVLDRLVNTIFTNDYNVAPFYFKIERKITTLRTFLWSYYSTFFRQAVAYLLQDPILYRRDDLNLREILNLETQDGRVRFIQEDFIKRFLKRYENSDWQEARTHWDEAISIPENLGALLGIRFAIIIDEFQDLKHLIYTSPTDSDIDPKRDRPTDLTASYDRQALSRIAPMLVSGSAVSMVFRTVTGGPLAGRFSLRYLKPMSIEDGATLAKRLLGLHKYSFDEELLLYLSSELRGHPYYIKCCVESKYPRKAFNSHAAIDSLIEFEVTQGEIYAFWESHFAVNRELINQDNDEELGKKIIYYFTKYNNTAVRCDEIARKLNISKDEVEKKLEKLYQADLVYRSNYQYYTFNDIMLMRYIQNRYSQELADVDKIDLREQGYFNYIKGKLLEMVVQNLISRFNNEIVAGKLFGQAEDMVAPRFKIHGDMTVKLPSSSQYQIDAYGEYLKGQEKTIWVAECKYRKDEPMTAKEVEKVLVASQVAKTARSASKVVIWLISTGGFTLEALALIDKNQCLFTGAEEINALAREYGIETKIA